MGKDQYKDQEATRRVARRLGLPERDVEQPDAVIDLKARVATDQRIPLRRTPLAPYRLEGPPDLGEETVERYPLEEDRPPRTGDVPLDTDIALGLDEPLHKTSDEKTKHKDPRREPLGTS